MKSIPVVLGALALIASCSFEGKVEVSPNEARAVTVPLTLAVNLSTVIRPVTHAASGSLYGVTETVPADIAGLVAPLNPLVFTQPARAGSGYQQPVGAAIPVAGRLAATTGKVMLRLADICPNWPYTFPGMTSWLSKVNSVITDKKASGYSNFYGYEIWNEPVYTWNTANGTFNNLWKQTYAAIRAADPAAKIIGPSEGYYDAARMSDFLTFCKANSCLPDIISWHELASNGGTGPSTITASVNSLRALESSLGIANLPISINEYCDVNHAYEGAPGPSAPFIAKFERLLVENANISWWWTAAPGRLGSLLGSNTARNGGWWFYHWYGAMTGSMVSVTAPMDATSAVDGFASIDATSRYASIAFGGQNNGTVTVAINGIPSWFGSTVRIVVEAAPWTNKDSVVNSTTLVSQSIKTVSGGSVSVPLTGLSSLYGYRILVLPNAAATTVSSGHTYKLVNLNSGKVLGITGAGTADGANALQWGDTGTADHDWTFTDTGSGVYKIVNRNSAKCLGVLNMSSLDGANALQWTDAGTADQRWVLVLVS